MPFIRPQRSNDTGVDSSTSAWNDSNAARRSCSKALQRWPFEAKGSPAKKHTVKPLQKQRMPKNPQKPIKKTQQKRKNTWCSSALFDHFLLTPSLYQHPHRQWYRAPRAPRHSNGSPGSVGSVCFSFLRFCFVCWLVFLDYPLCFVPLCYEKNGSVFFWEREGLGKKRHTKRGERPRGLSVFFVWHVFCSFLCFLFQNRSILYQQKTPASSSARVSIP